MRRIALFTALIVLMAASIGCGGRKASALNGNWGIDADKQVAFMKDTDMFKKLPDEAKKKAEESMKSSMTGVEFSFKDGKIAMKGGPKNDEASYKVTSTEGDKWTIETTDSKNKTETATVTWTDNDHIILTPPGKEGAKADMQFYLVRKP